MNAPDPAALWPAIAALKPRLKHHVQVHRHRYRGHPWYVLQDGATARYYRFDRGVYEVVRLMDGKRSVAELRERVSRADPEAAPSEDELAELLVSLHACDLLRCDVPGDVRELLARQERASRRRWARYLRSPFLIRLPLLDPDRFLARCAPALGLLPAWLWSIAWLGLVGGLATAALVHWRELEVYWETRALAPYNLTILCLVYPLVKGLHELAHALSVKRWGGEVHEMGIMLILLMPLPYVDASAASGFRDKRQRMLVGAAGIMAELALAALGAAVWFNVETGIVRDVAFDVMLIGGISTVLFNGNPLLRFDGYYILADAIEIPNLASRAGRYYGYLVQRYLFGLSSASSPVVARGERAWFLVYGLCSPLYRLFVLLGIALFVAEAFLVVGVIVGGLAIGAQILYPAFRHLLFVCRSPLLAGRRPRAVAALGLLAGAAAAGLCLPPVPSSTPTQGVVWVPEGAQVRAAADGFLTRINVATGAQVRAGDVLFESEDPLLETRVRALEWTLRELDARRAAELLSDRTKAGILAAQIERARADLLQAKEHLGALSVPSPATGTLVVTAARHLPGRFVRQGDVLGYVADRSAPVVRAVVGQGDVGLVRRATRAVEVKLADDVWRTLPGTILREVPAATERLPERSLGTAGGGPFAVDPGDPEGRRALDEVFLFDIELPASTNLARWGTRAHLRFVHDREPLADQWMRSLRQLFLRRLSV